MSADRSAEDASATAARPDAVEAAGRFALSEDWLATIVGLVLVVLMMLGVVTAEWLPW